MKKFRFVMLVVMLSLSINSVSYASYLVDQPLTKSEKVTWDVAKKAIEDKLADEESFTYYNKEIAIKEIQYLRYVCVTHNVEYITYKGYEDRFIKLAKEKANIKLSAYDKKLYEESRKAYAGILSDDIKGKEKVIADTGFSPSLNVLPFKNLTFNDSQSGGVCSGMAQYEIYHFSNRKKLEKLNFSKLDFFVTKGDTYGFYENKQVLDKKINAKGDKVLATDDLFLYEPSDPNLRKAVPKDFRMNWKSQDNLASSPSITLSQVTDEQDKRLLNSIIWLWYWTNRSIDTQINMVTLSGDYSTKVDVLPDNMLGIIEKHFKDKKPLLIGLSDDTSLSAHALVGYKLTQDVDDPNMYYLHVADSNYPGNNIEGKFYEFKIAMYRTTYKGKGALYMYYSPDGQVYHDSYSKYMRSPRFVDSDGRLLNTSINGLKWGMYTTAATMAGEFLNCIMFD